MSAKRSRAPRQYDGSGLFIICFILLLAELVAAVYINHWQLRLDLLGEEEYTVEQGEEFRDPGAEAVFGGELFLRSFASPPVTVRGEADTGTPGTYVLRYTARFLWFRESRTRTVRVEDTMPPVITLRDTPGYYILPGEAYVEEGYSALDNADGDITDRVERREEGGIVHYRVTDSAGNVGTAERHIPYDDPVPPVITLLGEARVAVPYGKEYREPGWTALDNVDGDISDRVVVSGEVDPETPGDYELRYFVEDWRQNRTEAVRIVTVHPQPVGTVYLTFDDGPSKYTEELLEILDKYDVKATFFVVNYGYNDVIGKEAAAGHSIGVHSATHDYSRIYASEDAFFSDLNEMNEIIRKQTGAYTDMIRFPGGSSNTISDFNPGIMTRLTAAVQDRGFQYFDWNVSAGDAGETTDPDEVFRNVTEGINGRKNSIVLMHDSKSHTVEAIERIIVWCIENNYELRPLTKDSPASHHRVNN